MLERLFKLKANGTTVGREVLAGVTAFAAMAYILAVNPQILSSTGMDARALLTATALAAALGTASIAFLTNYPISMAPGMGLNAFFAFTVVGAMGVPWQAALGLVFWSGVLFLVLTLSGIRKQFVRAVPYQLKLAVTCGIGFFILFLGLQKGRIIVGDPATFVTFGDLHSPATLLVFGGMVLTAVLVQQKLRAAVVISIALIAAVGLFIPDGESTVTSMPDAAVAFPPSIEPTLFQLDVRWMFQHFLKAFPVVVALLFIDLFDSMGTLIGVSQRAGLLDENGHLPKIDKALQADAGGTVIGAIFGTSTNTCYIESAAGVEAGGRTGLTALTTAGCFLLALFFAPVIEAIPDVATAPALIIVGVFMLQTAGEIDFHDFTTAVPTVLTIIIMPLAFSISTGLAVGYVMYVVMMIGARRAQEVSLVSYVLATLFLLHLIFH